MGAITFQPLFLLPHPKVNTFNRLGFVTATLFLSYSKINKKGEYV